MIGRKFLWGDAEDSFELATEVSFRRKIYLGSGSFGGVALRNEFPGQTTLELPQPLAWRTMKIFVEDAL